MKFSKIGERVIDSTAASEGIGFTIKSGIKDAKFWRMNGLYRVLNFCTLPDEPDMETAITKWPRKIRPGFIIIGAATFALLLKVSIASTTLGTNDVERFYKFGQALNEHSLEWTYEHSIVFNHPPLVAYYLRGIYRLDHLPFFQANNLHFPLLLRLPGIIADFVVVIALFWASNNDRRLFIPPWALVLLALSPVSLMVTGFHGNTDSVMVMFFVLASVCALHNKPALCGLFFALSCQIKIIPLLFLPIFFLCFFRRRAFLFSLPFALVSLAFWIGPLMTFPALLIRNVFLYGSIWGIWGITYLLRLTGFVEFQAVTFHDFPPAEFAIVTLLKLLIIGSFVVLAWRRRNLDDRKLLDSLAYAWMIFFVLAPGASAQYMVWLAPFMLFLSPRLFACIVATSSLFLFFFYNVTAGGFPWYRADSTDDLNMIWTPWSIWPWTALLVALVILWKNSLRLDPSLRLLSFAAVRSRISN